MAPRPTEICENCTVTQLDLRRCSGCSLVRYCVRVASLLFFYSRIFRRGKAHWKIHKLDCRLNVEMAKKAEALGPDHSDQLKAISKWSDHFSVVIGGASAHAMDIMNHPDRIDDEVVIIYVHFFGPAAKPPYTHSVVNAEVIPLAPLRASALAISPQRLELFERNLSPRPGMLRVLLVDRRFPWSHTKPFVVPSNIARWSRDDLWFEHLQRAVTRPGEALPPRQRPPRADEMHDLHDNNQSGILDL
ncbi:hypothetical protein DFH08DRAFT_944258 [Mycena albidolilacea]|uniref:MYND-type domain-containing protein n=1 Tax=Mycena albidolilacea TaxID=1033008 RepID=A0AAD6Z6L4_9AGAR|nr:hypothetical protein DFH08DRAFT_944258 [Mycena albidolilacea]